MMNFVGHMYADKALASASGSEESKEPAVPFALSQIVIGSEETDYDYAGPDQQ